MESRRSARHFRASPLADTVATTSSGQVVRVADLTEIYRLTLPVTGNPQGLADELTPLVDVLYAHRDGGFEPAVCTYPACSYTAPVCPNALVNGSQTGGDCDADIDADEAWNTLLQLGAQPGSMSTKIAVHDWGIDASHQDMMAKTSGDVGWSISHGTFVAGIAAANTNNSVGIAGVDWNARLLSVRIDNNLSDTDTYNDLRRAAIDLGAHIINASYSLVEGPNRDPRFSATVRLGFRDVYMMNRTATVAMGNTFFEHPDPAEVYYPAAFGQGILAVGATDDGDVKASFSRTGNHIDVAAPGHNVLSSVPGNSYIPGSGTSFAAPHAAGIAGLLLAVKPWLDNDDIEQIVRLTAEDPPTSPPGFDPDYGTGRVNANLAVQKLLIPNELRHLEDVGGTQLASDWQGEVRFLFVPPQLSNGRYYSERYPVERAVTFPTTFSEIPKVWGRGAKTIGYSTDGSTSGFNNVNYGMGWCEPVAGSITPSGCTLRTYVYKLFNAAGQFTGYWNPAPPNQVKFAYSVLGEAQTTDIGDGEETDSRSTELMLSSSNPFRPGGTLRLRLPQDVRVELEVFDVAGRRVGRIHQGALAAGTHAIPWAAREESGKLLPAGLYFVRLQAGTAHATQKLVLLR